MLGPGMVLVGTPVALVYSLHALATLGRRPLTVAAAILSALAALGLTAALVLATLDPARWTPFGGSGGADSGPAPPDAVACDCDGTIAPLRSFDIRLGRWEPAGGLQEKPTLPGRPPVFVDETPLVTLDDVIAANVVRLPDGPVAVAVTLGPAGADRLRRATAASIGRPLVLLADGEVWDASRIAGEIGEAFLVQVGRTADECCRLSCAVRERSP